MALSSQMQAEMILRTPTCKFSGKIIETKFQEHRSSNGCTLGTLFIKTDAGIFAQADVANTVCVYDDIYSHIGEEHIQNTSAGTEYFILHSITGHIISRGDGDFYNYEGLVDTTKIPPCTNTWMNEQWYDGLRVSDKDAFLVERKHYQEWQQPMESGIFGSRNGTYSYAKNSHQQTIEESITYSENGKEKKIDILALRKAGAVLPDMASMQNESYDAQNNQRETTIANIIKSYSGTAPQPPKETQTQYRAENNVLVVCILLSVIIGAIGIVWFRKIRHR